MQMKLSVSSFLPIFFFGTDFCKISKDNDPYLTLCMTNTFFTCRLIERFPLQKDRKITYKNLLNAYATLIPCIKLIASCQALAKITTFIIQMYPYHYIHCY